MPVSGLPYSLVQQRSLIDSNNELSYALRDLIGSYTEYRRATARFYGLSPDTQDETYLESESLTPRQVLHCLQMLLDDPDRYPGVLDCLFQAEPGGIFPPGRKTIPHRSKIRVFGQSKTDQLLRHCIHRRAFPAGGVYRKPLSRGAVSLRLLHAHVRLHPNPHGTAAGKGSCRPGPGGGPPRRGVRRCCGRRRTWRCAGPPVLPGGPACAGGRPAAAWGRLVFCFVDPAAARRFPFPAGGFSNRGPFCVGPEEKTLSSGLCFWKNSRSSLAIHGLNGKIAG